MESKVNIQKSIFNMVDRKASEIKAFYQLGLEKDDIKQELMVGVLQSLNNFDIKQGSILNYVKCILDKEAINLIRFCLQDKRRSNINCLEFNEIAHTHDGEDEYDLDGEIDKTNLFEKMNKLPAYYKYVIEILKENAPFKACKIIGITPYKLNKILSEIKAYVLFNKPIVKKEEINMKNISTIELLSIRELANLSMNDLYDLNLKITETYQWTKQLKEKLETALHAKFITAATQQLSKINQTFGEVRIQQDGFTIDMELPKKVEWDQECLRDLYTSFSEEERNTFFRVSYSVNEKAYEEAGQFVQDMFNKGRSVQHGKPKITIIKNWR